MFTAKTKKHFLRTLPIILVALVLAISLWMLNLAMHNPDKLDKFDAWLLPLYFGLVTLLSILVLWNLVQVLQQLRARAAGSRFTIRLLTGFIIITLIPVLIVTYFSLSFIGDRIDSYFDTNIETSLGDSIELSGLSLKLQHKQSLLHLKAIANEIANVKDWQLVEFLEKKRQLLNAEELVLLDEKQVLAAVSIAANDKLIPHSPAQALFNALRYQDSYYQLEPIDEHNFYRIAVKVGEDLKMGHTIVLTALIPSNEYVDILTDSVESARQEYKKFNKQREAIKRSFRFVLLVILIVTVLFSVWAAFVFSRRLTRPVRTLVEGTMAVASGDLNKKLPVSDRDDFSLLARSFNTMTSRLYEARREREISQQQVQRQHDYLNAVMEHITSSVITLDEKLIIRRINSATEQMLGLSTRTYLSKPLASIRKTAPELCPLLDVISPHLQQQSKEWQCDISLHEDSGHKQVLICKGAMLTSEAGKAQGYVIVIDEVTELIQAEHDAAWSEVARRLAHEIKNPLTPIQLSAERLSHKLTPILDEKNKAFVKRMTSTISNQVNNMQSMVNAFSEYARAPALNFQKAQLNELLVEIGELYRVNPKNAIITVDVQQIPEILLDTNRFRQLLVNLVKNALEALPEKENNCVCLSSKQDNNQVILTIADNGRGIDETLLPQIFEPYITNKNKGTGLGLAIVKKIVEEHSGSIIAQNNKHGGASFVITLPID